MNDVVDVLLIEDNLSDAEMARIALKKRKPLVNITVIADGAGAMEFVGNMEHPAGQTRPTPPRLILLDLKLPLVDGLRILEAIRATEALKFTPVVVLTSGSVPSDIARSYRLGANAFVVKPVGYHDFVATLGTLADFWLDINEPADHR